MWVNQSLLTFLNFFCSSRCCRLQNRGCPQLSGCLRVLLSDKLRGRQWKRWSTPQKTGRTMCCSVAKWQRFRGCLSLGVQGVDMDVVKRMYLALVLFTLLKETNLWSVAEKFHLSRGFIQTLLSSSSAFCSCVLHFTEVRWELLKGDSRPVERRVLPSCSYSGAGGVLALQSSADGADAKAELLRDGGAHPPDGGGGSHGG